MNYKIPPNVSTGKVLDPETRLKEITSIGNYVDIDVNIPPQRYYRSGLEMVRMANVYLDEGSLENAFILYMRFMTLFIEKIRKHPDFNLVSQNEKYINNRKLKEVFPKAEKLKTRLLERYKVEYERFIKDEKRRRETTKANELMTKDKEQLGKIPALAPQAVDLISKVNVTPAPNITGELYPSDEFERESVTSPMKPRHLAVSTPSVNRNTKPSYLLSPTVISPHSKLRTVVVPGNLIKQFTSFALTNTARSIETCGILAGQLKKDELVISHLLIPQQTGSHDSCETQREEDLFEYQDQHDLITFGWIHTHPTQTAFLSSVDLHTHCSYQMMMPEAIAIVCSPKHLENKFFILTPDYGLDFIANCPQKGFHPHPTEPELYTVAGHVKVDPSSLVEMVDLRV